MKYVPKELTGNVNVSKQNPLKQLLNLAVSLFLIFASIYILLGFLVDFAVRNLPDDVEEKMGSIFISNLKDGKKANDNNKLKQLLHDLLRENQINKIYSLHLVDNKKVNALALPGGNIVLFSGLIEELEYENELVYVLGHEIGHFKNRDHLRGLGRRLVLVVFSSAFFGADSNVTNFLMNGLMTIEMQFSQQQETAADLFALKILNNKYGHVAGAISFIKKMDKKDKRNKFLAFLSTHPHPENRIKAIEKEVKKNNYLLKDQIPINS
ncbi:M48 family metallopeptidase [Candidatus Margulisiibacteriota bacterium]